MRENLRISGAAGRWKSRALSTIALTAVGVLTTQAAWAQTAPAAGTLPGSFSSNQAATYTNSNSTTATIGTVVGNAVLQWGGTPLGTAVSAPSGITTNPNFSIGAGATLNINGAAASVLVNDLTGNPSQIFGTLNAGTLAGPLYVANTNGVIVGATGAITAPAGLGLIGYGVDSNAYAGTLNITGGGAPTVGGGDVTVANGATISSGGAVLVATNGTVNIGANGTYNVIAGFAFTTTPGTVSPSVSGPRSDAASSTVNFTAPATLTVNGLAGGVVNNAANLTLSPGAVGTKSVLGQFTNTGQLVETAELGNNQFAGGFSNLGTVTENAANLVIVSDKDVSNTGVLKIPAGGGLVVEGANVDIEGTIQVNGTASSSTNPLSFVTLLTLGSGGTAAAPGLPWTGGVVDIGTSLFSNGGATVAGNAIRVLSGGIFASAGDIALFPGTGAANVADPFKGLTSLGYTFSMFPDTSISATGAGASIFLTNPGGATSFSNSSGLNLDGQLSAPTINVTANNINSNNGLNGGFAVPNGGTINLTFFGNVNNRFGAGSFLNNYVPVTVGPNGTKVGTANIFVAGSSASSGREQFVNLLVNGNVNLGDLNGGLTAPGPFPTAPLASYANNHLVVTATGNIGLRANAGTGANTFYWPGLVILTSGATASDPTAAPNATASISLGTTTQTVNLSNIIPADLTTPSIGGQTGAGGVHLLTNNLNLAPGTGVGTVTISNDSWVNFLTPALATAFQTTSSGQFKGGVIQSNGQVNVQTLPAADFQPK